MTVEASADQDQFRSKMIGQRFRFLAEPIELFLTARPKFDRHIDCQSLTRALPCFVFCPSAWIKGKAVHRQKRHVWVVPECCLGSISVVDVPVND